MKSEMKTVRGVIALLLPVLVHSFTTTISLSKDQSCGSSVSYDVSDDDEYLVKWDGDQMDRICSMKFKNKNTDRTLCIEAESFDVTDCSLKVEYYAGLLVSTLKKSYRCFDSPSEYCGDVYDAVKIKVDATGVTRITNLIFGGDSFTLKVYSKKADYNTEIGAGTGSTVVILILVIIVVVVVKKRRQASSTVVSTNQAPTIVNITTTPGNNPANPQVQTQY